MANEKQKYIPVSERTPEEREKKRAYQLAYYHKTMKLMSEEERDRKNARQREYWAEHYSRNADRAAKKAAYDKIYCSENQEKITNKHRRWQRENAPRLNGKKVVRRSKLNERYMLNSARERAKKSGVPFDITVDDIFIPDICPVLGIPLRVASGKAAAYSPSLDKIIPALGYVRGNICVISHRANKLKRDGTLAEIEAIAKYMREHLA